MKRILVTGASGFVGQHLCAHLVNSGYHVRALSRHQVDLAGIDSYRFADWDDITAIHQAVSNMEAIIHLAGRAHVMREKGSILDKYRIANVCGTETIMTAAAECGVQRVILSSSVKAVGEFEEDHLISTTSPSPKDPYGISKLESEIVLHNLGQRYGIETCVFRLPLVYGPGVKGNVRRLLKLLVHGIPLPLRGISNTRSMVGIRNLCAYFEAALTNPIVAQSTLFVGDSVDLSTEQFVRLMAEAMNKRPKLFWVPPSIFNSLGKIGDFASHIGIPLPLTSAELRRLTGSLTVDITETLRLLAFAPPWSPDEEIRYMVRTSMSKLTS